MGGRSYLVPTILSYIFVPIFLCLCVILGTFWWYGIVTWQTAAITAAICFFILAVGVLIADFTYKAPRILDFIPLTSKTTSGDSDKML